MPLTQHGWLMRLALAALLAFLLLSIDKLHFPHDVTPAIPPIDQARALQVQSNITKRAVPFCDWSNANVIIDGEPVTECQRRARLGSWMLCMLQAPDPGVHPNAWPPPSKWVRVEDMHDFGWTTKWTQGDPKYTSAILPALRGVGADVEDTGSWFNLAVEHSEDTPRNVASEDVEYPKTEADYASTISFQYGVLIATGSWSPDFVNAEGPGLGIPQSRIVPLKQWSDLMFLALKQQNYGDKKRIEHIFRYNVVNDETTNILAMIVEKNNLDPVKVYPTLPRGGLWWPGLEFTMDKPQAKALLNAPNSKGVAWLYGQHKNEATGGFGVRTIDRVNIFNCEATTGYELASKWCIYFHITSV